ncbi:MAG: hypothetical protein A3F12_02845 [Gammaproteobacteria bacterium RIFCSPHIGHO2_12_FULL_38_14]|nr:MAG: hypothetical protein A3F12_02845 [Gammaproteobacteria bacterium RIFCSPHIGHO2_12_FULL_38_14]
MKRKAAADIAIFGGGIAGLWLLNRLRQSGFSVILFESHALGGGQTHKSQGIIHGGMKYALQGVLTKEAHDMSALPQLWKACLAGHGEIDLSHVSVLSSQQYLWTPHKLTAKIAGFLANTTLNSKVSPVAKEHYPSVFQHPIFKGEVFALDEIVLDVPSLTRELVKSNQDAIFKIDPFSSHAFQLNEAGEMQTMTVSLCGEIVEISAQQFIFTAGSGNELLIKQLNRKDIAMQRRPLHMVMVKVPFEHALYAHCMGFGPRPRVTITTHYTHDGHVIWYLGGQLAEEGVTKDSATQIKAARRELASLFSWLDFQKAEFSSFLIDRAEPFQKNGLKPESFFIQTVNNIMIAWPTKLALAPKLSADILSILQDKNRVPHLFDVRDLRAWPIPPLAMPIWEEAFCKSVA